MTPEQAIGEMLVKLQRLADLIDQFLDQYPCWHSHRQCTISSLRSVANDLDSLVKKMDEVKVAGATAQIAGGIAIGVGAILLPFTGGASFGLCTGGAAAVAAGAVTVTLTDLAKYGLTKSRCEDVDRMLQQDAQHSRCITDIFKQIHEVSQEIKALLDELHIGAMNDPNMPEKLQVLYLVAQGCGDNWIGEIMMSVFYPVARKMRANRPEAFTTTRPPVEVEELELAEEELEEDFFATEETPLAEGEVWTAEMEAAENAEMAAVDALEFEVGAISWFLPAAILVEYVSINELISAIKEIEHGSKAARKIREMADKLRDNAKTAEDIYKKMKLCEPSKQRREEEKKKNKTRHRLVSAVSTSTFNIKGKVQNDSYKKFLERVFGLLKCSLHHLQECTWKSPSVWAIKSILPDHLVSLNLVDGTVVGEAGIAGLSGVLDLIQPSGWSAGFGPFPDRIHYRIIKSIRTLEVISIPGQHPMVNPSETKLDFLSFSYHGRYKVKNSQKKEQIVKFIEYVGACCREQGLPAIVGGDFNFDIRKIPWQEQHKIKIFGGTSEQHSSIDFLCTVHGETFETKMGMMWPFFGYLDIAQLATPDLAGKITNHPPYFGCLYLYKDLPTP